MSLPRKVVLATSNPGKLRELQSLLGNRWRLIPQGDLEVPPVEETGRTFYDNALLKARHATARTGLPAIADDSGLEVDALNGAPGVLSARYAGPTGDAGANNQKLLDAMRDVPASRRTARFRCVVVFVRDGRDAKPMTAEGTWEGSIAQRPAGHAGFGYDPIFLDAQSGLTAAELSPAEKNARSHRGQALRALRRQLITARNGVDPG